eukprot:COSAG04_NODE_659_length_11458_cov_3.404173_14_plen_352_part_01
MGVSATWTPPGPTTMFGAGGPVELLDDKSLEAIQTIARSRGRALQDGACINVAEDIPEYVGRHLCGHMTNFFAPIDYLCEQYMCPDEADDEMEATTKCMLPGLCDALCGFCQAPAEPRLPLGETIDVKVTTTDKSNNPHYHNLAAESGVIYRVRAWPDRTTKIYGMLLIVATPSGTPIRRIASNSGSLIEADNASKMWMTPAEMDNNPRDVNVGCNGDQHIDIVFKATETGDYSIGLGQLTDMAQPRSDYDSDEAWTSAQFRATASLTGEGGFLLDPQWGGPLTVFGTPTNGTLTLRVEEVGLPPLAPDEQLAMEDLKSKERGIAVQDEIWDADDHPCLWGGRALRVAYRLL